MSKLSKDEKKQIGPAANKARTEIEESINKKLSELKELAKQARFKMETIDVTEPGQDFSIGVKHPITRTIEELSQIFMSMGYSIAEGPKRPLDTHFIFTRNKFSCAEHEIILKIFLKVILQKCSILIPLAEGFPGTKKNRYAV